MEKGTGMIERIRRILTRLQRAGERHPVLWVAALLALAILVLAIAARPF